MMSFDCTQAGSSPCSSTPTILGYSSEKPYPVTAGVESASGTLRLVLACTAYTSEEKPLGVVFTALIPGRRPRVSVAPVEAHVPREWQEFDDSP
jgi:hypothetical protein